MGQQKEGDGLANRRCGDEERDAQYGPALVPGKEIAESAFIDEHLRLCALVHHNPGKGPSEDISTDCAVRT